MKTVTTQKFKEVKIKWSKIISIQLKATSQISRRLASISKDLSKKRPDEKSVASNFKFLLMNYPAHPAILKKLLEFLQIVNSQEVLNEFSFKNLKQLYLGLNKFNPNDYDLKMEYFYFLKNVLDDSIEARKVISELKSDLNTSLRKIKAEAS